VSHFEKKQYTSTFYFFADVPPRTTMSAIDPITEKPFKHALGTIVLLNSTNYATWKADCEVVLYGIKAWKIVNEEEKEPEYSDGMSIYK